MWQSPYATTKFSLIYLFREKHRTIPAAINSYEHLGMCKYFMSKSADMAARALEWKAKIGALAAASFRQIERYIELVRCQDDVLATIKVADYLQACGSVTLFMRTAGQHEKIHAETEVLCIRKIFKYPIGFF